MKPGSLPPNLQNIGITGLPKRGKDHGTSYRGKGICKWVEIPSVLLWTDRYGERGSSTCEREWRMQERDWSTCERLNLLVSSPFWPAELTGPPAVSGGVCCAAFLHGSVVAARELQARHSPFLPLFATISFALSLPAPRACIPVALAVSSPLQRAVAGFFGCIFGLVLVRFATGASGY